MSKPTDVQAAIARLRNMGYEHYRFTFDRDLALVCDAAERNGPRCKIHPAVEIQFNGGHPMECCMCHTERKLVEALNPPAPQSSAPKGENKMCQLSPGDAGTPGAFTPAQPSASRYYDGNGNEEFPMPAEPTGTPAPCPLPTKIAREIAEQLEDKWFEPEDEQLIVDILTKALATRAQPNGGLTSEQRKELIQIAHTLTDPELDSAIRESELVAWVESFAACAEQPEHKACRQAEAALLDRLAELEKQQLAADGIVEAAKELLAATDNLVISSDEQIEEYKRHEDALERLENALKGKFLLSAQPNGGLTGQQVREFAKTFMARAFAYPCEMNIREWREVSWHKYDQEEATEILTRKLNEFVAALSEPRT